MQATGTTPGRPSRTFTELARRQQIVGAAISTIAEVGYRHASFAQIAKRAGLSSTGLISYHFAGKDELIREVVGAILADISAFMAHRMAAATRPAEALRSYIEGNVAYISAHGEQMKALMDIFLAGAFRYDADAEAAAVSPLAGIFTAGQDAGEFRTFDPSVMAALVQRAIDGLPFLLDLRPDLDVAAYGREVVTVFDLATRTQL